MTDEEKEDVIINTLNGVLSAEKKAEKPMYITTPIYYVNDKPHIGHAYTTIIGDVLARYGRLKGKEVFYVTGTDENSQKNFEAAQKNGREHDVQGYLDEMAQTWQSTWENMSITNTDFIRTTETRHHRGVEKFWRAVQATGDIYKGLYEGWYCVGCEAFLLESDVVEGKCPTHQKPVSRISEENYFFRLSNYRDALLEYINVHPEFIQPDARKHEVISYIKDFMEDISISRHNAVMGIPVPDDPEHKIYVWFDALINYLTAVGYGTDENMFERIWPADLHLVGKDIIKFHCALWPAMLMSAGLPLPRSVFAHGFFTIDGKKMSKSLGNVIDPVELSKEVGMDAVRYFLLREISCGEDGDFSTERLKQRYQSELGNELGNLSHRVIAMTETYCDGTVPAIPPEHDEIPWIEYHQAIQSLAFGRALDCVWSVVRAANKFIEDQKPWVIAKTDSAKVHEMMGHLCETLRQIAWMIAPIMPQISSALFLKLGLDSEKELSRGLQASTQWGLYEQKNKVAKGEPLFPRLIE